MKACAFFFSLMFFAVVPLLSQKVVEKVLANRERTSIYVDAGQCYSVYLKTADTDKVSVHATLDGEYRKDLVVAVEEEGSNVFISTDFQPNFVNPNDKLSAHKVLSIALEITLPEQMRVSLSGTATNVNAHGNYTSLKIVLADGNCRLDDIGETITVKTQSGGIFLSAKSGNIDAQSQYGQVFDKNIPLGNNHYHLLSIEGDIHILKTE